MATKAVEIVRKIRDAHFEKTKDLSIEEQIAFFRKKSEELQKSLRLMETRRTERDADSSAQTSKT